MSFTLGDSLQEQILRGEVYYALWTPPAIISPDEDYDIVVSNPTNDTEFVLDINLNNTPATIVVKRGTVVNAAGASITIRNRKYLSTGGNTVTMQENPVSYISEGTLYNFIITDNGKIPIMSPGNIEAPIILEAGINYLFRFTNNGGDERVFSIGASFRELV